MLGILWFFLWQSAGIAVSYYLFPEKRIAVRLWLGSVIGTLLSMWAPIPFAFLRGFGITAHIAAAIFALALHALWFARRGKNVPCAEDAPFPLTELFCFAAVTHREGRRTVLYTFSGGWTPQLPPR